MVKIIEDCIVYAHVLIPIPIVRLSWKAMKWYSVLSAKIGFTGRALMLIKRFSSLKIRESLFVIRNTTDSHLYI